MVKTKVKKKEPQEVQEKTVTTEKNKEPVDNSSNLMMPLMFLLLIIIIILQVVILLTPTSQQGMTDSSALDDINEKITRVDNFFSQNIEGYESSGAATQELTPDNFPTVDSPDISNRPVLGSDDAPITLVEYSDFGCSYCARFTLQQFPGLQDLIDDGTVKFVYKDFAIREQNAPVSAACVFEELGSDAYKSYQVTAFENYGDYTAENLKQWALDLGIEESTYDECIQRADIQDKIRADYAEAQSLGIGGTPSFVLNDKLIVGACPEQTFRDAVSAELEGTPFYVNDRCEVITA